MRNCIKLVKSKKQNTGEFSMKRSEQQTLR